MADFSDLMIHHPETAEFWQALEEGRFLIRFCADCEKAHWYPRAICPHCHSAHTEWREGSGEGNIYSYSVMRRAETPYTIAYVRLDEGPILMTNIVDSDLEAITVEHRVRLAWGHKVDGQTMPMFALS
ncbi:Zn-ribbon domain-containing OB-fold protein [Cucumibacter marinus]|uniref:Zn-ribbon domain-containing OB-fold protein n=1 Tax=Cucumibacter marinus TaxID=1121252 RepID=UPI00041FB852|nr:OB-fold domain-containing protein [Cucumibacter marinus]